MTRDEIFELAVNSDCSPPVLLRDGRFGLLLITPTADSLEDKCGIQVPGEELHRWIHCDDLDLVGGALVERRQQPTTGMQLSRRSFLKMLGAAPAAVVVAKLLPAITVATGLAPTPVKAAPAGLTVAQVRSIGQPQSWDIVLDFGDYQIQCSALTVEMPQNVRMEQYIRPGGGGYDLAVSNPKLKPTAIVMPQCLGVFHQRLEALMYGDNPSDFSRPAGRTLTILLNGEPVAVAEHAMLVGHGPTSLGMDNTHRPIHIDLELIYDTLTVLDDKA